MEIIGGSKVGALKSTPTPDKPGHPPQVIAIINYLQNSFYIIPSASPNKAHCAAYT